MKRRTHGGNPISEGAKMNLVEGALQSQLPDLAVDLFSEPTPKQ